MSTSRFNFCMGLMLATALSACASRPDPNVTSEPSGAVTTDAQSTTIMVTVNHTSMSRPEMRVYVEPVGGVRTEIGMLDAGEQKVFTYRVSSSRSIRFVGIPQRGGNITSPPINVPPGDGVQWDVGPNTVRIRR